MPSRVFVSSQGATGQYLIGGTPFDNNMTTYTLTAWIRPTAIPDFSGGNYFPVIWKGSGTLGERDTQGPSMSIYSDADGNLQLWCDQSYDTQDATVFTLLTGQLVLNSWNLICFVISPGVSKGYVNGTEVVYDSGLSHPGIGTPDDDSTNPWTISVDVPGGDNSGSFVGQISDVRIYTRALNGTEVAQLAVFTNPSSVGLSAEWPMCGTNPEVDIVGGNNLTNHLSSVSPEQPHAFCGTQAYSEPDDRNYSVFPNNSVNVQGTLQYTVPAHPSTTPPVDSRAVHPVDSRASEEIPLNSRTPGVYGPGEN